MRAPSHPSLLLALLIVLAPLALAGCIAPEVLEQGAAPSATDLPDAAAVVSHLAGGITLPDANVTGILAEWFDLDHEATEPTLGVTSTGTIFYAAAYPGPEGFVTDILRSRDGGVTWEDVTPYLGDQRLPPSTGDPYIYVDPATDRVFSLDMFPALSCSFLSFSDDEGDSWTSQPAACMGNPPPYDHQTIAAGPPAMTPTVGYPNIVYQCTNRVTDALCARSLDGGLTWSAGTIVDRGLKPERVDPTAPPLEFGAIEGLCSALHGHLAVGSDGTVYLPKVDCSIWNTPPVVAVSHDDGLTWSLVKVADDIASSGPDPAVTTDADGNAYYTYVSAAGKLMLATSTDAGRTWSAPRDITHPLVDATHLPAIAARDDGRIVIAYVGTENLPDGYENSDFQERAKDGAVNNATWNGYLAIIDNALDADSPITTARVNDPADPLVRGYCGPGRCPGMYDFIDVVFGPDGNPYAAFVDACIGDCAGPDGTYEMSQGRAMGRAGAMVRLASS